jgi:glycerophosphoryl diester phosphodiesterase
MRYLLLCFMANFVSTCLGVEIVAHRGASFDAPENTLAAFKLGFEQGADAGELDIYLSKDGKMVVLHDKDTLRIGGPKKKPAEQTLEDLRAFEVSQWGKWKGSQFHEKIPLLEEVLAILPSGKKLVIEIKCGPEALPELQKVLRESGKKPDQINLISFGYETIRDAKALMPQYAAFLLQGWTTNMLGANPKIDDLIAKAQAAHLDGLDLEWKFPITKEFVQKVKAANLRLFTWTVDDSAVARQEIEAGLEAITTNRPQWLREQLKN